MAINKWLSSKRGFLWICLAIAGLYYLVNVLRVSTVFKTTGPTLTPPAQPVHAELTFQKEVVDNSKAIAFLTKYKKQFHTNKKYFIKTPDPNNPETVTTWWQAAAMVDWYMNAPLRYQCQNKTAKGNWFICQDHTYFIKPPCLVYSFGIDFDFSFDDGMADLGCEVHSFDPSMNVSSYKRGNNSHFHNMGLGAHNTDGFNPRRDRYVKNSQIWKMRTVQTVMKILGHQSSVIDVLKIDVEGYEWAILDNVMESGILAQVGQLLLEFHLFPDFPLKEEYVYIYKTYTKLREMSFREYHLLSHDLILNAAKFNNQGEMCAVNVNLKRPTGHT